MNNEEPRILAFAIRARWLGFAALEEPAQLLDWGMLFYQQKLVQQMKSAKRHAESVISRLCPTYIVILYQHSETESSQASVRSITREICNIAKTSCIPITCIGRASLRNMFSRYAAHSKHQIALVLARQFPELAWRLPPERKIWQKEDWRMALFDAVAAAVTYRDEKH